MYFTKAYTRNPSCCARGGHENKEETSESNNTVSRSLSPLPPTQKKKTLCKYIDP